jgi:hypothetical protein
LSNEQKEEELKKYTDEVETMAINLASLQSDIAYQGLIVDFVTLYPQYKGLFK